MTSIVSICFALLGNDGGDEMFAAFEMMCTAPLSLEGIRVWMSLPGRCNDLTIGECCPYVGSDPVVFDGIFTHVAVDGTAA